MVTTLDPGSALTIIAGPIPAVRCVTSLMNRSDALAPAGITPQAMCFSGNATLTGVGKRQAASIGSRLYLTCTARSPLRHLWAGHHRHCRVRILRADHSVEHGADPCANVLCLARGANRPRALELPLAGLPYIGHGLIVSKSEYKVSQIKVKLR